MKNVFFAALCCLFVGNIYAQNRFWSLPNRVYDVDLNSTQLLPTGSPSSDYYDGSVSNYTHTVYRSPVTNKVLFFIIDGKVYDEDGKITGELQWSNGRVIRGLSELVVVPDPGNCQRFYIFTAYPTVGEFSASGNASNFGFYSILDLSMANQSPFYSGKGSLVPFSVSNPTYTARKLSELSVSINDPVFDGGISFAATQLRPDGSHFLYVSTSESIFRYKITSSGLTYDNYQYTLPNGTLISSKTIRSEFELKQITVEGTPEYRIAVPYNSGGGGSPSLLFAKVNFTTGDIITSSIHSEVLHPSQAPYLSGVEFSPNGRYVYFTHVGTTSYPARIRYFDFDNNTVNIFQPSGFTIDYLDYQRSFIEYSPNGGVNNQGRLLIVTNNRISSINNPNNPTISTSSWTNSFITLSPAYNISTLNLSPSSSVFNKYTLPDQIDDMNYDQSFNLNNQVCCLEYRFNITEPYVLPTGNNLWTFSQNPFNVTSGVIEVREGIIVPQNSTLEINGLILKFAPGVSIKVHRGSSSSNNGGKLIIKNSTLTKSDICELNGMWKRIQVEGVTTVNQNFTFLGFRRHAQVEIFENSIVEYAEVAVRDHRITNNVYVNGTGGGIVRANNSTFRHNGYDFYFYDYRGNVSGHPLDNISYVDNCQLQTSGNLLDNSISTKDVRIYCWNNNGVKVRGNNVQHTNPTSFSLDLRGVGLALVNSRAIVERTTLNSAFFSSFSYGVYSLNFNSAVLTPVKVDNVNFNGVWRGIYLGVNDNSVITRNEFNILETNNFSLNQESYGLYLASSTGYTVTQNNFTSNNDPNIPNFGNTIGVIVHNSGEEDNLIFQNTFSRLNIGGQSQQINANSQFNCCECRGLQWKCNTFVTNQIHSRDITNISGRIRFVQGDNTPTLTRGAGNAFSRTTVVSNFFNLRNEGTTFINYVHHNNNPYEPINVSAFVSKTNSGQPYSSSNCRAIALSSLMTDQFDDEDFSVNEYLSNILFSENDNAVYEAIEFLNELPKELVNLELLFKLYVSTSNFTEAYSTLQDLIELNGDKELYNWYLYLASLKQDVELEEKSISLENVLSLSNTYFNNTDSIVNGHIYISKVLSGELPLFSEPIEKDTNTDKSHKNGKTGSSKDEMLAESNAITIAPNPTADILYVNISTDENLNFEVIDITGKVVLSGSVNQSNSTIAMNRLNSGVYFVKIFSKEEIKYEGKVVKF